VADASHHHTPADAAAPGGNGAAPGGVSRSNGGAIPRHLPWLPRWVYVLVPHWIWPRRNGQRPVEPHPAAAAAGDDLGYRAEQLGAALQVGGARLHIPDLVPYAGSDWYTVGVNIGRELGDLASILRSVRGYLRHSAQVARERVATLKKVEEELRTTPAASAGASHDEQVLTRLRDEITELQAELKRLTAEQVDNPVSPVAERIRKNQDGHVGFLTEVNQQSHNGIGARIRHSDDEMARTLGITAEFDARIADLRKQLLAETDKEKRQAIQDRLRILEDEWLHALDFRKQVFAAVQEQTEAVGAWRKSLVESGKELITTESRRDQEILEASGAALAEPTLARSKGYLRFFLFAVLIAATGEFAVMNHYTGSALGVGRFTDLLSDIIAGRDRLTNFLQLLFVSSLALLPFAFGFFVKGLLEAKLPKRGDPKRWICWLVPGLGIGYFASLSALVALGDRVWPRNILTGLVVFFFSATLVVLNGWLLHHYFLVLAHFRRLTRDRSAREEWLRAEVRRKEAQVSSWLEASQRRAERRARARVDIETQTAALRVIASGADQSEVPAGEEAVIAAIQAGYREGLVARAGGSFRDRESAARATVDELSTLWRKLQILSSMKPFPAGGEREEPLRSGTEKEERRGGGETGPGSDSTGEEP
jgi:hypothetical protein